MAANLADNIFKCNFINEKFWISNRIPLKFVPRGPTDNRPAFIWVMAWHRLSDKPLSEPMLTQLRQPHMLCCHCLPLGLLHVLGAFGYFHKALSHLTWHKIVCIRYLACTFSQIKSINMFSMFLQSGFPRHFLWRFIVVWTWNLTVFMFMYINAETWVFGTFHAASARQNISGVWGIHWCIHVALGGDELKAARVTCPIGNCN